jgi:hypothetical protein
MTKPKFKTGDSVRHVLSGQPHVIVAVFHPKPGNPKLPVIYSVDGPKCFPEHMLKKGRDTKSYKVYNWLGEEM